jgi:hypothetical protein
MTSQLSQFFIDKARNELHEDENRRKQSLELMRHWLLKHPFVMIKDESYTTGELKK